MNNRDALYARGCMTKHVSWIKQGFSVAWVVTYGVSSNLASPLCGNTIQILNLKGKRFQQSNFNCWLFVGCLSCLQSQHITGRISHVMSKDGMWLQSNRHLYVLSALTCAGVLSLQHSSQLRWNPRLAKWFSRSLLTHGTPQTYRQGRARWNRNPHNIRKENNPIPSQMETNAIATT